MKVIVSGRGCNFHLWVSPLLMSATRPAEFAKQFAGMWWVDSKRILKPSIRQDDPALIIFDTTSPSPLSSAVNLLGHRTDFTPQCTNSKWVAVTWRSSPNTLGKPHGVDVGILQIPTPGEKEPLEATARECVNVQVDGLGVDQPTVIMWFELSAKARILAVDAERTFHSKKNLCVRSSTTWDFFDAEVLRQAFSFKMRNGAQCFICRAIVFFDTVFRVMESTGAVEQVLTRNSAICLVLSKLGKSMFCLSSSTPTSTAEIWDCNNVAKPLRVINFGARAPGIAEATAIGFLIEWQGTQLRVMDASSGCCVLALTVVTEYINKFYDVSCVW
ncbi:hypothetical protein Pelo_2947 [Pelomyxa schiedti]|nr:hypothetical protein Pelo_2947 [Pelomyxa schiedti]